MSDCTVRFNTEFRTSFSMRDRIIGAGKKKRRFRKLIASVFRSKI